MNEPVLAPAGPAPAPQDGPGPPLRAPAEPPPAPIDPLAPGVAGRYDDHLVTVLHRAPPSGRYAAGPGTVRTAHFVLAERGRRIEITHWLTPGELDNGLAGLLAAELFGPGWLSGSDIFERVFTGVIRSALADPLAAWLAFYDNTLTRIRQCWREPGLTGAGPATIAELAPVYAHALRLIAPGSVLDFGSCFGFLPLLAAQRPANSVTASDLSGGTMRLLAAVAAARGTVLRTLVCDAARVPVPDASADTVTLVHLLEHVPPGQGAAMLREALRIARRKVVVAVPFEEVPEPAYGHVRTFGLADLRLLGAATGRPWTVHEHHGGWLILTAS